MFYYISHAYYRRMLHAAQDSDLPVHSPLNDVQYRIHKSNELRTGLQYDQGLVLVSRNLGEPVRNAGNPQQHVRERIRPHEHNLSHVLPVLTTEYLCRARRGTPSLSRGVEAIVLFVTVAVFPALPLCRGYRHHRALID